MRHLSAMAFLSVDEIAEAVNEIKPHLPEEANKVTKWFENNYVDSRIRSHFCNSVVVLFPKTVSARLVVCLGVRAEWNSTYLPHRCTPRKTESLSMARTGMLMLIHTKSQKNFKKHHATQKMNTNIFSKENNVRKFKKIRSSYSLQCKTSKYNSPS